jgi:hypothetical protein
MSLLDAEEIVHAANLTSRVSHREQNQTKGRASLAHTTFWGIRDLRAAKNLIRNVGRL